MLAIRFRGFIDIAVTLFAATMLPACTHAFQTSNEALPDRMHVGEFSFERPQSQGWYLNNVSDPPMVMEFTKRGHQAESQIVVMGLHPDGRVTNLDELDEWAQNLPDADKVITPAPGHGAICVRYHGRSVMTLHNDQDMSRRVTGVITTDEDSLECIDPYQPGLIVRFIATQRSATGGTPQGTAEAYAFLKSIQFSQK
ncbi:MAG TPA: hypothetical protein VMH37_07520 [Candidatus Binataceae bacterium]|nr:hypothetical protein [Candidatus Binataceae bacterium]